MLDLIGTVLELLTLLLPILLLLAFELVHARGFAFLLPLTEWDPPEDRDDQERDKPAFGPGSLAHPLLALDLLARFYVLDQRARVRGNDPGLERWVVTVRVHGRD